MTDTALSPTDLRRTPCPVADRLILSGDLHPDRREASRQLDQWVGLGVRGIVDCRAEWSDERLVAKLAPDLVYIHAPAQDHGGPQHDAWFTEGVARARAVLDGDPDAHMLVHCHMGVNRGPSMGLAILLDLGWDPIEALDAIRAARPIAAVAYAPDATRWHGRRSGMSGDDIEAAVGRVRSWIHDNGIDVSSVVGRIRMSGC